MKRSMHTLCKSLQSCETINQFKPLLARFLVNGLVHRSIFLSQLVEFLSFSQNTAFLSYASLLVEKEHSHYPLSSTYLYNILIKGFSQSQYPEQGVVTYMNMLQNGCKPNNYTYSFVVKTVGVVSMMSWNAVREGIQIHGQIVGNGFMNNVFVVNTLISMYSVFKDMESAKKLFDECPNLDTVSWTSLIDGYAKLGQLYMARILFDKMPERDEVSWNAIISAYAKNGDLDAAQSLFDTMPVCRNTVTWNSMISGFAKSGFVSMARKLFDEMPQRNIVSWNSMISAYAQNGELELAQSLFNEMPERNNFSWSSMISGYAQSYRSEDALTLFKNMIFESRTKPNEVTLVSVLSACGHLMALDQGKWIHEYIRRNGMRLNDNLGAALISMYAKCGCAGTAFEVFLKLDQRNVSTWNALITGFAINGLARKALEAFVEMQRSETKPNNVTFVGVLMACRHGGLVEEGRQHFGSMFKDYGIQPEMMHYGCMIDLLGRAGLLVEAEAILKSMPMDPDATVLGAMLGACRIHGNIEMADKLREDFLVFCDTGCHILLSNIYAAASRWIDASDMRNILKINEIKKEPGFSAV